MSPEIVGFIGIMLMFILMVMRIWVGVAMALVGFLGFAYLEGWDMALLMIGMEPYSRIANYSLAALPLFLFMGALVSVTGISQDLYIAARKWIGQVRGGLAMATAGATGLFAAICGDSVACVVTMCKVAYPEMKRYNYDNRLSLGTIAASGTVGILIPPSVGFILYGLLTEQSIGKLFIAGIGPGVLLVLLYMSTIYILCRINPDWGPVGPKTGIWEKIIGLKDIWPMGIVFLIIIVGIYRGIFTPTEAGAIGVFGAILVSLGLRRFNWKSFIDAIKETAENASMTIFLLLGGYIFMRFVTVSHLPVQISDFLAGLAAPKLLILLAILAFYIVLGAFISVIGTLAITIPIIFPVILSLGYDPIWFGVIMVRMMEIGMISPPCGINLFVLNKMADTPLSTIYRGVFPFLVADIIHVSLLIALPEISLYLTRMM